MKFTSLVSLALSATLAYAEVGLKHYANDIDIGFAINSTFWEAVPAYSSIAQKDFNLAVGENACKLSGIQAEQGIYDYTDCDRHLEKATELGMKFRGHCLVWHNYQPVWFENLKGDDLKNAIVDHITNVLTHYRGKIDTWDIVNEAIDNSSTGEGWVMRDTFLYREVPDFVDIAFKTAREVDPDLKLYYNDYHSEGATGYMGKSISVYNFVKDMVERGVPLDGVGIQYHVRTTSYPAYEDVMDIMAKYAELGLEVQITEMDVTCTSNTPEEFALQAEIYGVALKACLNSPNCNAFLLWGFGDQLSWRDDGWALIYDHDLQPKPAYYTLLNVLKEYNDKTTAEVDSDDEDINVDGEVVEEQDSDSDRND